MRVPASDAVIDVCPKFDVGSDRHDVVNMQEKGGDIDVKGGGGGESGEEIIDYDVVNNGETDNSDG